MQMWTGSNATNRSITSPGRTAVTLLVLCRAPWMANDELRKSWWPEVGEDHAKRETNAWTGSNATNRSITSPGRTAVIILVLCRAPWMANDELRKSWWPEVESNHRHRDFQSLALPTELSGLVLCSPDEMCEAHAIRGINIPVFRFASYGLRLLRSIRQNIGTIKPIGKG